MNRSESVTIDRIDNARARRRTEVARQRIASHAGAAMAEVVSIIEDTPEPSERVIRLKARLAAHTAALKAEIGPASLVGFLGHLAGLHGPEIRTGRGKR